MADGDDEEAAVYVGSYDVRLFGEICGLANDVIASLVKGGDESLARLFDVAVYFLRYEGYPVSYGHGIGCPNTANAEVALDFAVKDTSRIRFDGIAVSCIAYYESVHQTVMISLFLASSISSSFLMYLS